MPLLPPSAVTRESLESVQIQGKELESHSKGGWQAPSAEAHTGRVTIAASLGKHSLRGRGWQLTAAEMTGSLLLWLGVRCPEDWGGEKSTVIEKRGIVLQSRGSEEFPGRVWAEKKVKDKQLLQAALHQGQDEEPRKGQ